VWNCSCDSNPSSIMLGLENACDLMGNFGSMSLIITTIWVFLTLLMLLVGRKLSNYNLTGTIPAAALSNLTALTQL
jgi:ABC-type sulfate transport system permease subunit